jgi:predicted PurR-regulated permease PerM
MKPPTVVDEPPAPTRGPATHERAAREIRVPRLLVAASELSWRFLVCVAAIAVVVYALSKVSFAVIPVLIALLASTLLVPPTRAMQRRGVPPAAATAMVFVFAVGSLVAVIALLAGPVADEFDTLGAQVRDGADKLGGYVADLPLGLSERDVQDSIDHVDDRLRENRDAIGSGVLTGAQFAAQLATGLIFTLVLLFFFVKDGPKLWAWVLRLFPKTRRRAVADIGDAAWRVMTGYVRGVAFVALFDAVFIGLALWLIGVPLVLPLAVVTFFAAFVPLVGAVVAGAAAALVALVANGLGAAVLVVGAVLLVQQLEGNVIYPVVVGRSVQLHAVAILLAVTIGGVTAGIVGAALAVPVAAVIAASTGVIRRHTRGAEVVVETAD